MTRRHAGEALHVTNGDSVAQTLRATSLGGTVLSWRDVLHEGPLAFELAESRSIRGRFLAARGWGDGASIREELRIRDELLERAARERRPIVLWFEHDLYDQLQLLQILAALGEAAAGDVELVQADEYLGGMDAEMLEELFERRRRVTTEQFALAADAWHAVCENSIEDLLPRETSALPYLAPALRRLLEEREPLPRTKRQLLRALADGPKTPLELFAANQAQEDALFLGDAWCFQIVRELAEAGLVTPVPVPPPRGDYGAFTATRVALTAAGRELV